MTEWDDVRPYWGEKPEVLGPPLPPISRPEPSATPAMRYQWRIEEGLCGTRSGTVYCSGTLDQDRYCTTCGKVSKPYESEAVEQKDDYVPRLPGALFIEEYSPAALSEDEAA